MRTGPNRQYTEDFRQAAAKQVIEAGRRIPQVGCALEVPKGTLGNWVARARRGALMKRPALKPVTELEAEVTQLRLENARLRMEKEIPKKGGGVLREGVGVRHAWIAAYREAYPIPMRCELLSVPRSGLCQALRRAGSRASADAERGIGEQIRHAQRRHRGRYGRRRMTPEVSEALGRRLNHKRIGRLMRAHGLGSRKRRAFRVVTTDSRHAHPIAPNVIGSDFVATAPKQKWLADLTYIRTDEG